MKRLLKQIELLERVDQLIRLKATGRPKRLAERLNVSEATVFRIIDTMKAMHAPISYNIARQSYIYTETTNFKCGFYIETLNAISERKISGGMNALFSGDYHDFNIFPKQLAAFESSKGQLYKVIKNSAQ